VATAYIRPMVFIGKARWAYYVRTIPVRNRHRRVRQWGAVSGRRGDQEWQSLREGQLLRSPPINVSGEGEKIGTASTRNRCSQAEGQARRDDEANLDSTANGYVKRARARLRRTSSGGKGSFTLRLVLLHLEGITRGIVITLAREMG